MRNFLLDLENWWNWNGEFIKFGIVVTVLMTAMFLGAMRYSEISCAAKTGNMGFEHRWSLMGGCQIEVSDGKWIPLESYYFKQEQ